MDKIDAVGEIAEVVVRNQPQWTGISTIEQTGGNGVAMELEPIDAAPFASCMIHIPGHELASIKGKKALFNAVARRLAWRPVTIDEETEIHQRWRTKHDRLAGFVRCTLVLSAFCTITGFGVGFLTGTWWG